MSKFTILIVDDSEMNRAILADMLSDDYDIIEAENGFEAVAALSRRVDISLVLLDFFMPGMDGFEVLSVMNENGWIDYIPVIMVSAESSPDYVERAYELGVTDFITRPFDAYIVRRRVVNTLMLYTKQKELTLMVDEQIYERERRSELMINILGHIMEFRNGESGQHIHNVRRLTEFFLRELLKRTDRYPLTESEVATIVTASALHDIGKIAIDEKILNKPGRLTDEEFAIMKTHSAIGAQMLEDVVLEDGNELVKTAYNICRWHHERYDGRGYPDGISGDDIPVAAQVVALADVYDALTSKRVYKDAFDTETAVIMITAGQCGAFNPILLECLADSVPVLRNMDKLPQKSRDKRQEVRKYMEIVSRLNRSGMSERTLRLLDYERMKNSFFASLTEEIQFEYTVSPPVLTVSEFGARKLGIGEVITDPQHNSKRALIMSDENWRQMSEQLRTATPENPNVSLMLPIICDGEPRWHHILARSVWSDETPPQFAGAIGKAIDIQDAQSKSNVPDDILTEKNTSEGGADHDA